MSTASIDRVTLDRRVPPLGGFNLTYLGIEIKRRLRNRRTLFFTVAFPVVMFVLIGLPLRDEALTDVPLAPGGVSVAAYILVSMAMYGAMMSATQTGAAVAVERSQGGAGSCAHPLNPFVNIVIKMIAGMALGLLMWSRPTWPGGRWHPAHRRAGSSPARRLAARQRCLHDTRSVRRLPHAERERGAGDEPDRGVPVVPRRPVHPLNSMPTSCRRSRVHARLRHRRAGLFTAHRRRFDALWLVNALVLAVFIAARRGRRRDTQRLTGLQ